MLLADRLPDDVERFEVQASLLLGQGRGLGSGFGLDGRRIGLDHRLLSHHKRREGREADRNHLNGLSGLPDHRCSVLDGLMK